MANDSTTLIESAHVGEQLIVAPPLAGTVTIAKLRQGVRLMTCTLAWVSNASGAVSGHVFSLGASPLWEAEFIPNLGSTQPSNSYSVTLQDQNGVDYLIGKGLSLSNAAASLGSQAGPLSILPGPGSLLDLRVTGAGNAKTGTVILSYGPLR